MEKISAHGPMPFSEYMATALYHPELGYYAKDLGQVGKGGDFFTSVSVGPLFGRILAHHFVSWWQDHGRPSPWRVIEAGAHDGTLAADVLQEISSISPDAYTCLEYVIPEPLPRLQAAQRARLQDQSPARFIASPSELASTPLPGIAFGNEVLDALPFEMIRYIHGGWRLGTVAIHDGELTFQWDTPYPAGPVGEFPEGYQTEIRQNFGEFFRPFFDALEYGKCLWLDYGYDRDAYYHPARITGTIRTFAKHQAGENPLVSPGEEDITAHVDFTAAEEAAHALGCTAPPIRTQSAWLTTAARDLLLSMEGRPDADLMRQFQTLTHPGQLGSRFYVFECHIAPKSAPAER